MEATQGVGSRFGLGMSVFIISLAAGISAFWLLVFYPGVMSYDALEHWEQALANRYDPWHPPGLAMLMHVTQYTTNQPDLLCFVQGTLFWTSLLFLLRRTSPSDGWFLAATVFILLVPSLWLHSNAVSSNAWMTAFGLLSIGCAIRAVTETSAKSFWLAVLWFSGAVILRREVLVLLPVFVFLFYRYIRLPGVPVKSMGQIVLIILLCVVPARAIELAPSVEQSTKSAAGHGLLHRYVGTIKGVQNELPQTRLEAERSDIDTVFGAGTFDRLMARFRCRSSSYITSGVGAFDRLMANHQYPSTGFLAAISPVIAEGIDDKDMPFVFGKVATAAVRHPLAFIEHNLCYYKHLLQIQEIVYQDWGVLRKDVLIEILRRRYEIPFDSKLPTVKNWYVRVVNASLARPLLSQAYSHYWVLMAAVIVWIWGVKTSRPEMWMPALFAVFYPLAYVLIGPGGGWRYLLFSHACGWVCIAVGIQHVVIHTGNWARNRH